MTQILSREIKGRLAPISISIFVFLFTAISAATAQTTFNNTAALTINDRTGAAPAPATSYPSNIVVSGFTNQITKVTVRLNNFTHQYQDDAGVLLVSPTGQKVRLMTDAGGNNSNAPVTITFDDAATNFLPSTAVITTGTYKPTQGNSTLTSGTAHPANFPAPAPAAPYSLLLSSFNNTNPNGTWSLYVDDDTNVGAGSIAGGWSLTITALGPTAASSNLHGRAVLSSGRGADKAFVTIENTNTGESRTVPTNPFGYFKFIGLPTGDFCVITIRHKRYIFQNAIRAIQLLEDGEITFTEEMPE